MPLATANSLQNQLRPALGEAPELGTELWGGCACSLVEPITLLEANTFSNSSPHPAKVRCLLEQASGLEAGYPLLQAPRSLGSRPCPPHPHTPTARLMLWHVPLRHLQDLSRESPGCGHAGCALFLGSIRGPLLPLGPRDWP